MIELGNGNVSSRGVLREIKDVAKILHEGRERTHSILWHALKIQMCWKIQEIAIDYRVEAGRYHFEGLGGKPHSGTPFGRWIRLGSQSSFVCALRR